MKKYILVSLFVSMFLSINCSSSKVANVDGGNLVQQNEVNLIDTNSVLSFPVIADNELAFYKIHILDTNDFEFAKFERARVENNSDKTVFLVGSDNMWSLLVGDYYSLATSMDDKELFNALGWGTAKIVQYRALETSMETDTKPAENTISEPTRSFYTVQVIATSKKKEAENLSNNLKKLNIKNAEMVQDGSLWKIQIGKYPTYDDAKTMLSRIKNMGFNDSWITKKN